MKTLIVFIVFLLSIFIRPPAVYAESSKSYFHVKSMQEMKLANITRQTLDYSCGAAALSLLLHNYFDDTKFSEQVLLKDIILRLNGDEIVSRVKDGFSMLDLKLLSQRLGYMADGIKLSFDSIYKLRGPVIILLHKNSMKHFVVLKGAKSGRAFIADPIYGNVRLSEHELKEQWKGEVLIVGIEGFNVSSKNQFSIEHESPNIESVTVRGLQNMQTMKSFSN